MSENAINPNVRQAVAELSDVLQPGFGVDGLAAFLSKTMPDADLDGARRHIAELRRHDSTGGVFKPLPPVEPGSFEDSMLRMRAQREASQGFGLGRDPVESEDQMRRRLASDREAKGLSRHAEPPPPPPTDMEYHQAIAEAKRKMDAGYIGLKPIGS